MSLLLLVLSAATARAEESNLVLKPGAEGPIGHAFEKLRPALPYESIQLDHDHVLARICPSGAEKSSCFAVRLEPAESSCAGKKSGAFCVTYPAGNPGAAAQAVEAALKDTDASALWFAVERPPSKADLAWRAVVKRGRAAIPMGFALLLIAVPLAFGAGAGLLLRRRRKLQGRLSIVGCVLLPPFLAGLFVFAVPVLGLWDALVEALVFGIGLLWSGHESMQDRTRRRRVLAWTAAVLVVGEVGCRVFLNTPAVMMAHQFWLRDVLQEQLEARGSRGATEELVCAMAYGDQFHPEKVATSAVTPASFRPDSATGHVLNLGETMVAGEQVQPDQRITARLRSLDPGVEQINASLPGATPDELLIMLRAWIHTPGLTGVTMYLADRIEGMDEPHRCSGGQSLLTYDGPNVALRPYGQHSADSRGALWLLRKSPVAYVMRVLSDYSSLAGVIGERSANIWRLFSHDPHVNPPDKVPHLENVLRAAKTELAARGIPLTVVLLPMPDWVNGVGSRTIGTVAPMLSKVVDLPIRDLGPAMKAAAKRGTVVFDSSGNLGPEGCELVAQLLHGASTHQ